MNARKLVGTGSIVVFVALLAGCAGEAQVTVSAPTPVGSVSVSARTPGPVVPPPPATPPGPSYPVVTEEWVHLPIAINYPSGGARLDDTARAMMRELHSSLVSRPDIIRVRVEGHADSQGRSEANERLAMERAQGVVDFAVGDLGLPRELFEIQSFGAEAELTSGTTAGDRLLNRRVEFSILVRRQSAQ